LRSMASKMASLVFSFAQTPVKPAALQSFSLKKINFLLYFL